MILRRVVLVVVLGVLGVGLGACGSSSGVEATVSTSDQVTVSSGGEEEGAACTAALAASEDNVEALCTKAADLGNTDGMWALGVLAKEAGDLVSAKSWYQKAADLGNQHAIDALAGLNRRWWRFW